MTDKNPTIGSSLPAWPEPDFSTFGDVEIKPLGGIQNVTADIMHRNWLSIPHVTHHDLADITQLEAHRAQLKNEHGIRITPLAFQIKAVVAALKAFPHFNASLDASGKKLVLKKYFNIGIAVDTPSGLLVPVIRDCDSKSPTQLAEDIAAISEKARSKGLSMAEMSGGCFTISSLGGIGGTAFTPIINAPEVAILGVTKAQWAPRRDGDELSWRLMLPLSLSYDHRVINGADAARFLRFLDDALADPTQL